MVDISAINVRAFKLWVGAMPRELSALTRFDEVVICCHPPPNVPFGYTLTYFEDGLDAPSTKEKATIERAANVVATALEAERTVAVLCSAGQNRSCLVAARALVKLGWAPDVAIEIMREHRGNALYNQHFVRYLRGEPER
jgi:hypothetical protein